MCKRWMSSSAVSSSGNILSEPHNSLNAPIEGFRELRQLQKLAIMARNQRFRNMVDRLRCLAIYTLVRWKFRQLNKKRRKRTSGIFLGYLDWRQQFVHYSRSPRTQLRTLDQSGALATPQLCYRMHYGTKHKELDFRDVRGRTKEKQTWFNSTLASTLCATSKPGCTELHTANTDDPHVHTYLHRVLHMVCGFTETRDICRRPPG
jgi:hypothetical protein